MWLIDLDDAQLQSGLGLTVEDIAVLRTGTRTASPLREEKRFWENTMSNEGRLQTCKAWRAGMNSAQHRIIAAGVIGNVLEWYDFAIYGYFAAAIGRQFFPHEDPVAQI